MLTLFLLQPEEEYFIRELTRKLNEQINSIRRELDNLKKMGLLRTRTKNRKKYYIINKNFILFNELRGIILKAQSDKENIAKKLTGFGDVDVIVLAGLFVEKDTAIDLLLVGNINKRRLEDYFTNELETKRPVRYSIMSKEEFLYRRKCKDKFLQGILSDPNNIIALNKLEKFT